MSEDGLLTADNQTTWRDGISEENRSGVSKFDTADSLAKGYLELEKSMGTRIKMPGDDSTSEEKSAFYQKLGRPDTADGYSRPDLAEGETFDEEFLTTMATVAHAEGVSEKQFRGFIDKYIGFQAVRAEKQLAADNAEADTTTKQLHDDWGADYDTNLETSKRALRELVPAEMKDEFVQTMTDKNLDNNLIFIKAFQSIGAKMLDDKLVKGDPVKDKEGYVPANPNSPEMYQFGEDEESKKAREFFKAKGHIYS